MKSFITLIIATTFLLTSCGQSIPMTDAELAEKYGYSQEEFQEVKEAAARMNMTVEDHLKMMDHGEHGHNEDTHE